jgi:P4 family phage/plasmid primase-like protien
MPGKDSGEHSATTGRKGVGSEDRLYVFSDATEFTQNEPYNKFAAYALLNHGGDFAAATRDLRSQGFGGELPQLHRATDAVSLVRPAAQVPVAVEPVDEQKPAESALAVQANKALPVLGHDGLPAFTNDVYTSHHWDEMGLASMYSGTFCHGLKYVSAVKEWMIWDGQRWRDDEKERHILASRKLLSGLLEYARRSEARDPDKCKGMVKKAEKLATLTRVTSLANVAKRDECIAVSPTDFNTHQDLVTVENGVLNLRTGELSDFGPALMLSKKIKAVYNPDAQGPRTTKFLESVQPDPKMRRYMQRLAGYTLLGNADERVLPIVHGKSGSGKSAFLEMLYYVLADFAAIADPSTLMPQPDNYQGPSEKLHSLMGSRFVKMSELPENASLNQALVKNITGSDTQKTRAMYGHPVEWRVEYTVWMATNNLPRITSTDDAIWKRVKPIHFPNVFVNEDGSVKNSADKDLGRQLARDEASFILNWLLEGIRDYLANGLGEPDQVRDGVGTYRDEMDTTRQFIAEAQENGQIKVEEGLTIPARDLYKIYTAWAAEAQVKFPVSINTFKQRLMTNGYDQVRVSAGMVWKGIGAAGWIAQAQTPVSSRDKWRAQPK